MKGKIKDKIRIGLIGYGKIANLYAEAVLDAANAEIVSVCGRNREKLGEFAAKWNIASRDTPREMASIDKADAVIVCTPHPRHCVGALEAFDAGMHVLVEKPMAVSTAQCDEMIAAAQRSGKTLSVVGQRRWFPPCIRIKNAIDAGKLGKPALLQLTILGWRDEAYYKSDPWRGSWAGEGGGILINQAAHQIDLMNWYMGPIEEVKGYCGNFNHPYIEVEDSAAAVLKFKNGGLGSVLVSNSQKPGIYAKVHVHGSSGASAGVQTDGGAMFIAGMSGIAEPPFNDLWTIPGEENLSVKFRSEDDALFRKLEAKGPSASAAYFFTRQVEDFCEALIKGNLPQISGEEGRETVKFIETMYKQGGAPGY